MNNRRYLAVWGFLCVCLVAVFLAVGQTPVTQPTTQPDYGTIISGTGINLESLGAGVSNLQIQYGAAQQKITALVAADTVKDSNYAASQQQLAAANASNADKDIQIAALKAQLPPLTTATYYVSLTGNDANPGSLSAPVKTIQHACDAAPAGVLIVAATGTYKETPTLSHVITLQAETIGGVIIDSGGKPFTFTGPPNCALTGIVFKGSVFAVGGKPTSHKFGVQTNSGWTMTDCSETSDSGGLLVKGDKIHLVRNKTDNNGQNGLGGGCTNSVFDDCESGGNNTLNFNQLNEAGGGKWTGCDHLVFNNYNCSGNNGVGLWLDGSNTNIAVNGGTFSGNHVGTQTGIAPGIQVEISAGPITIGNATIAGNDNGHEGLSVFESGLGGGVSISGCTLTGNQFGMREQIDTKTSKQRLPGLGNVTFTHNKMIASNSYGSSATTPNVVIDYNDYSQMTGRPFGYLRAPAVQDTLAKMQALGYELHATVK